MNRGSSVLSTSGVTVRNRFNEAPIHESGKFEHLDESIQRSVSLQ